MASPSCQLRDRPSGPSAQPPAGPVTITRSGWPSSSMAREPTSVVPLRRNQPPDGSPCSSIRGSLIRYPSPSVYSACVRLRLAIHTPPPTAVITPARRDSPRPAAMVRSASGPRPNTSRPPSGIATTSPDGVLTRAATALGSTAIAFLPARCGCLCSRHSRGGLSSRPDPGVRGYR